MLEAFSSQVGSSRIVMDCGYEHLYCYYVSWNNCKHKPPPYPQRLSWTSEGCTFRWGGSSRPIPVFHIHQLYKNFRLRIRRYRMQWHSTILKWSFLFSLQTTTRAKNAPQEKAACLSLMHPTSPTPFVSNEHLRRCLPSLRACWGWSACSWRTAFQHSWNFGPNGSRSGIGDPGTQLWSKYVTLASADIWSGVSISHHRFLGERYLGLSTMSDLDISLYIWYIYIYMCVCVSDCLCDCTLKISWSFLGPMLSLSLSLFLPGHSHPTWGRGACQSPISRLNTWHTSMPHFRSPAWVQGNDTNPFVAVIVVFDCFCLNDLRWVTTKMKSNTAKMLVSHLDWSQMDEFNCLDAWHIHPRFPLFYAFVISC